ncbi:hypothetical protein IAU59_004891 [Kwoniella sp. CBS 9459]
MDAFTAIFTTLSSAASSTTEAPRDSENNYGGPVPGCVIA